MITDRSVSRNEAMRTPQFYLLWGILFINVTAGIGILAQASPMMQDMFNRTPLQAAAVVSLISLFNAGGRFLWASGSDYIGRRNTYTDLLRRPVRAVPADSGAGGRAAAGGCSRPACSSCSRCTAAASRPFRRSSPTSSAPQNVGAIHGALLTAWSAAAIAGPVIITELSNRAKAALPPGADRVHIYDTPLQVLAALLAVGFVLTLLVRPLRHAAIDAASVRERIKA